MKSSLEGLDKFELAKESANGTDQLRLSDLRTRRKREEWQEPGQELGWAQLTKLSQTEGKGKVTYRHVPFVSEVTMQWARQHPMLSWA